MRESTGIAMATMVKANAGQEISPATYAKMIKFLEEVPVLKLPE